MTCDKTAFAGNITTNVRLKFEQWNIKGNGTKDKFQTLCHVLYIERIMSKGF